MNEEVEGKRVMEQSKRGKCVEHTDKKENQIQKFKLAPIEFELRTYMRNLASSFLNWKTCDIQFAMV
jgi:hypothetical protein